MNRGPGSLLTPEDTGALELVGRRGSRASCAAVRHGPLRRALAGLGRSCALAGFALLACLALVAVGTIGSLAWMLLVDH